MTEKTDYEARGRLAQRIVDCIADADGMGLPLVAAHLDTALNTLERLERRSANDPDDVGDALH